QTTQRAHDGVSPRILPRRCARSGRARGAGHVTNAVRVVLRFAHAASLASTARPCEGCEGYGVRETKTGRVWRALRPLIRYYLWRMPPALHTEPRPLSIPSMAGRICQLPRTLGLPLTANRADGGPAVSPKGRPK